MKLGSHVSCQGGFARAVGRAVETGCDCLQIFVSNPPRQWPVFVPKNDKQLETAIRIPGAARKHNQWRAKALDEKAVDDWSEELSQSKLANPIAHASYLINLASPKDDLFRKSVEAMVIELQRSNQLGLEGLVVHPGAFTDSTPQEGIARVIEGVSETLQRVQPGSCRLLLENTAGQGTCLGRSLEELQQMIVGIDQHDRVGICFDTCHAFAAGYEINTEAGFKQTRREIDDRLPSGTLAAIHLNDSKKPLGSRVDRHEHIGQGELGLNAFRMLLHDDLFSKLPGYLETEKGTDEESGEEWDVINLRTLRKLLK